MSNPPVRFLQNHKDNQIVQRLLNPHLIPLILILIVGTGLRFYQLGTESLWIDENYSIRDAEQLRLGTRPLYYLLLRIWMFFGTSDYWLRLLSVAFGIGSIVLIYLLSVKVASRSVALIAAFLMAVAPFFVGYSQEIRMYALSTFLTLWGSLAAVGVLEKNKKNALRDWIIARCLALLTTPLNVLLLFADFILIFLHFRQDKQQVIKIIKRLILIGLIWLPFAYVLLTVTSKFMGDWVATKPKPDILRIPSILTVFTTLWPLSDLPKLSSVNLNLGDWGWNQTISIFYMIYTLMVMFLFGMGLLKVNHQIQQKVTPPKLLWVAAWCLIPSLCILIISYISSSIWVDRYLIFISPYVLILITLGFQQVWRNSRFFALAITLIYFISITHALTHYYTTPYHDDWKGVAQFIQSQEKPGDIIAFYSPRWEKHLALPRYYKGKAKLHALSDQDLPTGKEVIPVSLFSEMVDKFPPTQSDRYWLVIYDSWSKRLNRFKNVSDGKYRIINSEVFPNSFYNDTYVYLIESQPFKVKRQIQPVKK